ncbi:MAG: SDR family oxidoreductase [Salaquimonas sp.]
MAIYDFSEKSVLISGAGGGLGLAAAKRFAKAGARLVLTDYNDASLEAAKEAMAKLGTEAVFYSGDVALEQTHADLINLAISKFGRLDIALNNAGIAHEQKRLEDMGSEESRRVLEVDILGVVFAMRAQLPVMRKQFENTGKGGVILNTASVAGLVGAPTMSVYAAAKHAVVGLTKAAAMEYARKGIRINALCPAFTRTNMVTKPLETSPHGAEKAEARLISNIPMARMGEVDEVVQAMLWACDPENSFYTGQSLAMDGGLSAG